MGQVRLIRNKETSTQGLLGAYSNRWRDFDFHAMPEFGGEIVSSKSHAEFEAWLDKNPQHAPELWTWHTWGTARKSRATWWAFSGNNFYAYWPLTEDEAKDIESWAQDEDLAMSFGFYVLDYDLDGGIIDRYRAFEASVVPRESAANKWTDIQLVATGTSDDEASEEGEKTMAISKKKYEALVRLHGEGFAKALVDEDAEMAETLDAAGYETKGKDPETTAPAEGAEVVVREEPAAPAEPAAPVEPRREPEPADPVKPVEPSPGASPNEGLTVESSSFKEEDIVAAIKRLEDAVSGDVKALADRLGTAEQAIGTLLETVTALVEAQKEEKEIEENERKLAAAPPSILASYMPGSILSGGAKTAAKNGDSKTDTAVLGEGSALAKQAPKPSDDEIDGTHWFAAMKHVIRN